MFDEVRLQAIADGAVAIPFGVFPDGAPWKGKGPGTKDAVQHVI